MSRLGKQPVSVPAGVKVTLDAATRTIRAEGPKGKLSFTWRPEVNVALDGGGKNVVCSIDEDKMEERQHRAYWGTTRARIANLLEGVAKGFSRKLEVVGVGWNAKPAGAGVQLSVGFCKPIMLTPPAGVTVTFEGPAVLVSGPDLQQVGQFAAQMRSKRPPEPYNGKGVKYSNEVITRKQGKVFGA